MPVERVVGNVDGVDERSGEETLADSAVTVSGEENAVLRLEAEL
jgi:hypothetical protein